MKKILALTLAAVLMLSMIACSKDKKDDAEDETDAVGMVNTVTTESGSFEYDANESGEYEIVSYTPASVAISALKLPTQALDGRDIIGIADEAFKGQNSISLLNIPATYEYIGTDAFYDCDVLAGVVMTDSITRIGAGAFQSCDVLASVTMSSAVKTIESRTFADCVALKAIDLSGVVTLKDAFLNCKELTSLKFSDTIESVDRNAFLNAAKLQYTVEGNCKYLGSTANPYLVLVGAENLNVKECTVNNAAKVIANNAFASCNSLETLTLGSGIKFIGSNCFNDNIDYNEYENMYYLGTAENPYMYAIKVILSGACETLTLHKDVAFIANTAILGCNQLKVLNYQKSETDFAKVIKAADWNKDMVFVTVYDVPAPAADAE